MPHLAEDAGQKARDLHLRHTDLGPDLRLRPSLYEPQVRDEPLPRLERLVNERAEDDASFDGRVLVELIVDQ